ncbi:MAG: type IV pilus biogenesis/stability protein PilW, partial [Gammaproteobacteria bacterium]|nr:type IV pilus biogenesis/stability protein PilW [Gammaproteobacteria bacterium]
MRTEKLVVLILLLGLLQACVTVVDEKEIDAISASNINLELGLGYLKQNYLELANEKLLKSLRYNPKNVEANYVYAFLQDNLGQVELAEHHYQIATDLDPKNSEAANNYGQFLCRNNRQAESEEYFLQALKNPLYKTPEFALTNAATCLMQIRKWDSAQKYLIKALAVRSNFGPALLRMSELYFEQKRHDQVKIYIDRYHLEGEVNAKSLWLAIRNALELDSDGDVAELSQRL